MKILAIIGSPKGKGDGYKIIRKLETEMLQLGKVFFEYLFLKNVNLKLCKGCFLCISKGKQLCPLKDDMEIIEEKIENSDGIILVSPGYVYNVSWLMKNFIDRFAYTNHRPRFFDKKVLLIANAGAGMNKTIEAMRNTFGVGPEIVHELAYTTPPWPLTPAASLKQKKLINKASKKFYQSLLSNKTKVPSLKDYVRFKFFKSVSDSVKYYLPADYEYYKNKHEYYYDTRISFTKKIAAWFMVKLSLFFMRDISPKKH